MATEDGKPFFSARQRRTVEAFADVFIEGSDEALTPAEVAERIDAQLKRIHSNRTRSLSLILFGVEYVFPLTSGYFRPFSQLDAARRRRLIDRHLARAQAGSLLRNLAKLRALFLAGYYDDLAAHKSIGYLEVADRPRHHGHAPAVTPRPRLPTGAPEAGRTYDLCVIGSGAGGAVVAHHAAQAGHDVLVLEEGPLVPPTAIRASEGEMTALLYKEGGLQTTVDLGMTILQGRVVGGTTYINNAICFRLDDDQTRVNAGAPDVLRAWERLGARVDRPALGESYDRVEHVLGVQEISAGDGGRNGTVF